MSLPQDVTHLVKPESVSEQTHTAVSHSDAANQICQTWLWFVTNALLFYIFISACELN